MKKTKENLDDLKENLQVSENENTSEETLRNENESGSENENESTNENESDKTSQNSLLDKIKEALKQNANFSEQIKLSLLALNELLHSHAKLEKNYAFLIDECTALINELEARKGSFDEKAKKYLEEFSSLLENARLLNDENLENANLSTQNLEQTQALKEQCEGFLEEITKKALSFETQLEFLKQVSQEELPKIEGILNEINTAKDEFNGIKDEVSQFLDTEKERLLSEFKSLASEALTQANTLKEAFLSEINTARDELQSLKEELESKQDEALKLVDEKISNFDKKYTSIKYLSNDEPKDSGTRLNDIWLDTKNGIIRAYVKNPLFSHFGTQFPQYLAKRGDLWLNEKNELFCLREEEDLNLGFLKVNEKVLEAKFKQNDEPDLASAKLGDLWFKCQPFEVYYLENKSWVQIHQKLVRFKQESEPVVSATNVIEINDIWQNTTTNVFYIYANIDTSEGAAKKWIQLAEVFNYTKFKGSNFPEIAQDENDDIANKALMRDLFFKCDESEIYICLETSTDKVFKKLSEAKAEAKYKQELEPKILKENVLVFKNESDLESEEGFYKGLVFAYKPQSYENAWLRLSYLKQNAQFKDNDSFEISSKYARAYDVWYKERDDELFIYLAKSEEANASFEWKKIDFKNPTYTHTSVEGDRENAKLGEVYASVQDDTNPFIFTKRGINLEYTEVKNEELLDREIKPFWWYNSLLKDFYLRVKKVDYNVLKLEKDLNALLQSTKTQLQASINALATKHEALASKHEYAYKQLANNVTAIDFRTANNFKLNLTAANKTLTVTSVAGCEGKTGVIFVQGANFIKAFASPFNFRIAQSGFGTWELFSYCIINGVVRLTRS